jgi:glycosyltransferase involved in cell wall biosynthesis
MPQFHLLAFEGPDAYSRAGGLGTRVSGLSEALAAEGFDTHLWFVGDPDLPGQERRGRLALHRWCQWISRHHPAGVYDGEEGKHADYASSLPPFLFHNELLPRLRAGARAVVLAEEWQTADAVLHLDSLLRRAGLRDRVTILWNANNLFGFHHIDWRRLAAAATVTTVSRYMRYRMWELGIDPVVIPNGLSSRALRPPDQQALGAVAARTAGRVVVTKVARWDPDKRWLLAVDIAAEMKRRGSRPLLVARGGVESHGVDVLARATAAGLRVADRSPTSRICATSTS